MTSDLRTFLKDQLDAGGYGSGNSPAASRTEIDLVEPDAEEDPEAEYETDDDEGEAAEANKTEGDETETLHTAADVVRYALESDPRAFEEETGLSPVEYLDWARSASGPEWRDAWHAAGIEAPEKPDLYDLPRSLAAQLAQGDLDARVKRARSGR